MVERVKQNLVERGLGVAQLIPTIDKVVIIGEGNNLTAIRTGYAIAATMGWWLPFITLALFGLGILIARRRSTAVLGTGLGLAIGAATLAATLSIGNTAVGIVAGDLDLSPTALDVIYQQLVGSMTQTALVIMLLGALVAVIGWLMGGSRPARGVRTATEGLNGSARAQLSERGLDTGAFGSWLGRYRVLVRDGDRRSGRAVALRDPAAVGRRHPPGARGRAAGRVDPRAACSAAMTLPCRMPPATTRTRSC